MALQGVFMKQISLLSSALTLLCPWIVCAGSTTISGISSGGFMASQMSVIYSNQISGVATVAGGVFYCAQNTFQDNLNQYGSLGFFSYAVSNEILNSSVQMLMTPENVDMPDFNHALLPSTSNPLYQAMAVCMANPHSALGASIDSNGNATPMNLDFLSSMQSNNQIAPLANISQQRVLIYQGTADHTVNPAMAYKLQEFYTRLGVNDNALKMVSGDGGAHNFPTDRSDGTACNSEEIPFMANCNRDLAGDVLQHLLNRTMTKTTANMAHLYTVQQVSPPVSVAAYGYLYANDFCLNNPSQCDVHVALHGCEMSDFYDDNFEKLYESKVQVSHVIQVTDDELSARVPKMGTLIFAQKSGYAEYAEDPANHVMIYFPQTQITSANYPGNPKGCWDWYGWTGASYATAQGAEPSWLIKQIQIVATNPGSLIIKK